MCRISPSCSSAISFFNTLLTYLCITSCSPYKYRWHPVPFVVLFDFATLHCLLDLYTHLPPSSFFFFFIADLHLYTVIYNFKTSLFVAVLQNVVVFPHLMFFFPHYFYNFCVHVFVWDTTAFIIQEWLKKKTYIKLIPHLIKNDYFMLRCYIPHAVDRALKWSKLCPLSALVRQNVLE